MCDVREIISRRMSVWLLSVAYSILRWNLFPHPQQEHCLIDTKRMNEWMKPDINRERVFFSVDEPKPSTSCWNSDSKPIYMSLIYSMDDIFLSILGWLNGNLIFILLLYIFSTWKWVLLLTNIELSKGHTHKKHLKWKINFIVWRKKKRIKQKILIKYSISMETVSRSC